MLIKNMKLFYLISLSAISFDAFTYPFTGLFFVGDGQRKSLDFQLDAYYSQIAYNQDFKDPEVMAPEMEADLYIYLLKNFLTSIASDLS